MGKSNDKKVVKEARIVLVSALSNLLESERERKFKKVKGGAKSRRTFCSDFNLVEPTVAHIETGRFLGLSFGQLRVYLAALRGKDDKKFLESFQKVRWPTGAR